MNASTRISAAFFLGAVASIIYMRWNLNEVSSQCQESLRTHQNRVELYQQSLDTCEQNNSDLGSTVECCQEGWDTCKRAESANMQYRLLRSQLDLNIDEWLQDDNIVRVREVLRTNLMDDADLFIRAVERNWYPELTPDINRQVEVIMQHLYE